MFKREFFFHFTALHDELIKQDKINKHTSYVTGE